MGMYYNYITKYGTDELSLEQLKECAAELLEIIHADSKSVKLAYHELQCAKDKTEQQGEEYFKKEQELLELQEKYPIVWKQAIEDHKLVHEHELKINHLMLTIELQNKVLQEHGLTIDEEDCF